MKKLLYFSALSLCIISASDSIAMDGFVRSEKSVQLFARLDDAQIVTRDEAATLQVTNVMHIRNDARAIDDNAFRDRQNISHITLNYEMKYIGEFSFANSSVESIVLGESLSRIRRYAFAGCRNLNKMVIPDNLKMIEANALAGSAVNYLSIPGKFMVYSDKDNKGNLGIYITPVNPAHGDWCTKIMTLKPGQELSVLTRKGGLNQNVVTTFGAGSSSDSED